MQPRDREGDGLFQRVADGAGRGLRKVGERGVGKALGMGARIVERAGHVDTLCRGGHIVGLDVALLDAALPESAILLRAAGVGEEHRQGRLALPQIVADILAERFGIASEVEHIVDELEGEAEIAAEALERRTHGGGPADDRTRSRGRREQRRRLRLDHGHVVRLADGEVLGAGELAHLTLGDGGGGAREHAERLERAHASTISLNAWPSRKSPTSTLAWLPTPCAQQDGRDASRSRRPHRRARGWRCACTRRRWRAHVAVAAISEHLRGGERQHRANALAAGRDEWSATSGIIATSDPA